MQFFTGPLLFLTPDQQWQSTDGKVSFIVDTEIETFLSASQSLSTLLKLLNLMQQKETLAIKQNIQ